ncbi:hypothetical protein AYO08_15600 [Pseudomonas putida]|uniref:DUF4145 domain-containing protein n=1 Tax=Pseudomonas putida TaxID=303 RepID=UPI0007DC3918|nr:DUF4145 domain-containing protein [Pseudomonas putida]OAS04038.1 hypothetical protein AYO08_15600 [Pseudomonas putida]
MLQDITIKLDRCPHCTVAAPHLRWDMNTETYDSAERNRRRWVGYTCQSCGGVILTVASFGGSTYMNIESIWPKPQSVDEAIPERARMFLSQAISSVHAPAGAVMLCASAVDAMLKEIGLKQGKLYGRIGQAAAQHLITAEMADWAHEVRLGANDQRHADEDADLPDEADARQAIEFAQALGQFLFVLPSRVRKGRENGQTQGS